jgi:molecular chaperone GrpE (heat shock protein)
VKCNEASLVWEHRKPAEEKKEKEREESDLAIVALRKESEERELKMQELTARCSNLTERLRRYVEPAEL